MTDPYDPTTSLTTDDVLFPDSTPTDPDIWLSPSLDNLEPLPTPIVGAPDADTPFWHEQDTDFTCAVAAQEGIIEVFTGEDISEAQLVYEATANGWLTDGGTSMADMGRLLDLHGIPNHQVINATTGDLMAELSQGHKVIVAVDGGEIRGTDHPLEDFFHQTADHAIWVTGVDFSDPDHPRVIINDSGDPDGAGKAYDLDLFVDAWQDSGFFYVATDNAPPDLGLQLADFDAERGMFTELVDWFQQHFDDFLQKASTVVTTASLANDALALLSEVQRNDLFCQF